ncbi:PAAR domain-containing protein [bacterium]|nr:PAAR domain-containing protein [bacterium]
MPPVATILTSMTVCPMVTGIIPHVGGPIIGPGAPTVLTVVGPVSVMGDMTTCVGPPGTIALGYPTVLAEGRPVAVVGMSITDHGGDIVGPGAVTVMVG